MEQKQQNFANEGRIYADFFFILASSSSKV